MQYHGANKAIQLRARLLQLQVVVQLRALCVHPIAEVQKENQGIHDAGQYDLFYLV